MRPFPLAAPLGLPADIPVIGMVEVEEPAADQLRLGIADDLAELCVHPAQTGFLAGKRHADPRIVEREPEQFLAVRQLRPQAEIFGQVAGEQC